MKKGLFYSGFRHFFSSNAASRVKRAIPFLYTAFLLAPPSIPLVCYARPIVPADDGTGTGIRENGQQFDIDGGRLSGDGRNLFHSFEKFGLEAGQVANFQSHAEIENILGRVVGGDISFINGSIMISGGNSNLLLMNPAGILFGSEASLNVPGDFVATTATGIGFGENWFATVGDANWAALVGEPTQFAFEGQQAIANFGNLSLEPGHNLILLAGRIFNSGTLQAPKGNITVAAVPGYNQIRISQTGHLLGLEIATDNPSIPLETANLPRLLTGGNVDSATKLEIGRDGSLWLGGSGIDADSTESGDAVLASSAVRAENLLLAASGNLTLISSELATEGNLSLRAGDTVKIRDGELGAGGALQIWGDRRIDILALSSQNPAFQASGSISLVSSGQISTDARFSTGGNFSILTPEGFGGDAIALYDPIISSQGDVFFGNYEGVALKIEAAGSITGVGITITGADTELDNTGSDPDIAILSSSAAAILRADVTNLANPPNLSANLSANSSADFNGSAAATGTGIQIGDISTTGGPAILSATGSIATGNIATSGGEVNATSVNGGVAIAGEIRSDGGNVTLEAAAALTVNAIASSSGNISLTGSEIDLANTIAGSGNLLLQAANPSQNIALGGSEAIAGSLSLSSAEIATLEDGFSSITIGRSDRSGTLTLLGDIAFRDSLTLNGNLFLAADASLTGDGDITILGAIDGDRELTLNAALGNVALNGAVGGQVPLSSLAIAASEIALASNIATNSGEVRFDGAVTLADNILLDANGGNIVFGSILDSSANEANNLTLRAGDITFNDAVGARVNLGSISIESAANVTANSFINAASLQQLGGNSTTLAGNLTASGEIEIQTGTIQLDGEANAGGSVRLNSANGINANNITSAGGNIIIANNAANNAANITTGNLASRGGNVSLTGSEGNDIEVGYIDASSINGSGGNVEISSGRFFRARSNFNDQNGLAASIYTAGSNGVGSIVIRHQGGLLGVPFIVGNGELNGTAAALSAGASNTISPLRSIPGSLIEGNISILTEFEEMPPEMPLEPEEQTPTEISLDPEEQPPPEQVTEIPVEPEEQMPLEPQEQMPSGQPTETTSEPQEQITSEPQEQVTSEPQEQILTEPEAENSTEQEGTLVVDRPIISENGSEGGNEGGNELRSLTDSLLQIQSTLIDEDDREIISAISRVAARFQTGSLVSPVLPPDPVLIPTIEIGTQLDQENLTAAVENIEDYRQQEFSNYWGESFASDRFSLPKAIATLRRIEAETGTKSAIVYVFARFQKLDLVLITASAPPVYKSISEAKSDVLLEKVAKLRGELTNPRKIRQKSYLVPAKQLYDWIVAPLEPSLEEREIDTIMFSMDAGLRSLPLAALHDGQEFLVQKYRFSLIPSINLTDTRYRDIRELPVLAMGASTFQKQPPLPAVPVEIEAIAGDLGESQSFLNESFTLGNLSNERNSQGYAIVHLATHAEFKAGAPNNSYIQLWDRQLGFEELRELQFNDPPVELLVLSACRTALGDTEAELGFAGLAVQAGVKSALASLWYVSDRGTLGLMTEFYSQLRKVTTKSEALRLAQVAMLEGRIRIQNGQLLTPTLSLPLPADLANIKTQDLSHPYYWSGFAMIGSPF